MLLLINGCYLRPVRLHRVRVRKYAVVKCPFCARTFYLRFEPIPEDFVTLLDLHLVLAHPHSCKVC